MYKSVARNDINKRQDINHALLYNTLKVLHSAELNTFCDYARHLYQPGLFTQKLLNTDRILSP